MSNPKTENLDIVILGAGLVGSSLTLALAKSGLKLALVDQQPLYLEQHDISDARNLVLSLSSQRIFAALDVWPNLTQLCQPIDTVHVTEQGACQRVVMQAEQCDLQALAYSVPAPLLAQQLHRSIAEDNQYTVYCPASIQNIQQQAEQVEITLKQGDQIKILQCKLLVLATGTDCTFRDQLGFETETKDYHQRAIVANIASERFYPKKAFERFCPEGPFALLPTASGQYCMVCVVPDTDTEKYLSLDDKHFLDYIQSRAGRRLGRFLSIGKRKSYELRYLQVKQAYHDRVLLLGNSAHTLHPNAAQGFNLALRDVAQLSEDLLAASNLKQDIGSNELLNHYAKQRHHDQDQIMKFSDRLTSIFYNDESIKRKLRTGAMIGTEYIWPVKQAFMHRALGIYGQQADMVKQPGL